MREEAGERLKNFLLEYEGLCRKYRCVLNTENSEDVVLVPLEEYGLYGNSELENQIRKLELSLP